LLQYNWLSRLPLKPRRQECKSRLLFAKIAMTIRCQVSEPWFGNIKR